LEAWSMYAGLCVLGVAAPLTGRVILRRSRVTIGLLFAGAFSAATIVGMEQRTISSTVPVLLELPGVTAGQARSLQSAGINTVYDLASSDPIVLAAGAGLSAEATATLVQTAQLATLRGIGNEHSGTLIELGVKSVCELSRQDTGTLFSLLDRARAGARPNESEVRVWVRAARRACADN
jgi:predicted RecB family nuclease